MSTLGPPAVTATACSARAARGPSVVLRGRVPDPAARAGSRPCAGVSGGRTDQWAWQVPRSGNGEGVSVMNAATRLGLALLGALLAAALLAAACSTRGGRADARSAVDAGSPSRFEMSVARP
ncbi:hypothetical protein GCM10017750_10950 [Streptomyces racemochromogenes]